MTAPILVDTTGLYALLDRRDDCHGPAAETFGRLLVAGVPLVTHPYVVVETSALVQRRLPGGALHDLHRRLLAVIDVMAVPPGAFDRAVAGLIADPVGPSLVDRLSFEVAALVGATSALAFDRHFVDAGLPAA